MAVVDPEPKSATPLVLYGAGSQVHVLKDILQFGAFRLLAILNDFEAPALFRHEAEIVVGSARIRAWIAAAPQGLHYAISIGNHHGRIRTERHAFLKQAGLTPAHLQHPSAVVSSDAIMGEACQLLALSFVGARARLGDAVIVNTRASIDHECVVGDGVHLAPGATLSGRVTIGAHTFLGAGSTVCPDVRIASDCIIGAGAVVVGDLSRPGTYVGVPARLKS